MKNDHLSESGYAIFLVKTRNIFSFETTDFKLPQKFWFQNHSALRAVKLQPHRSGLAASEARYAGAAVMPVPYQCLPYTLGTKMFRTLVDFSLEMLISMIV